jgi:hypothetical protein
MNKIIDKKKERRKKRKEEKKEKENLVYIKNIIRKVH